MMFGDVAHAKRPPRLAIARSGTPTLSVRGLSRQGAFHDVSFDLYPGEILGLAGLLGSGRTEVLRAVFGADPVDAGTIALGGKVLAGPTSPKAMKARGLGYTPESRKELALVQMLSTHDNLCLASLPGIAPRGLITRAMEGPFVTRQIGGLGIKAEPMLPVAVAVGRQPAEGGDRQLAEHRARR